MSSYSGYSGSNIDGKRGIRIPSAPYPPMNTGRKGVLRKSLSSSPHFRTPQQKEDIAKVSIEVCHNNPQIVSTINCRKGVTNQSHSQQDSKSPKPTTVGPVKVGPLLVELHRVTRKNFQTTVTPYLQAHGDTQLAKSVVATCQSWRYSEHALHLATGLSTGALCIHKFDSTMPDYFSTRHTRCATSVAWQRNNSSSVAIGLAHSHSKEYGCLLWDVERSTSKTGPLTKMANQSGVASLEWIDTTLLVGCSTKYLQIYDVRQNGGNSRKIAHDDGVHGIKSQGDFLVATYSKREAVKLWDIRRMDSSVGEIKWMDEHPSEWVRAIGWSGEHHLSIAMEKNILQYDTSTSQKPIWVGQSYVPQGILDVDTTGRRYMVVLEGTRSIVDVSKSTIAPVVISRQDGRLVHSFESKVWTIDDDNNQVDDISSIMMKRASQKKNRYSMDALMNIVILENEKSTSRDAGRIQTKLQDVIRLWSWIARAEPLCYGKSDVPVSSWNANSLTEAGIWQLLGFDNDDFEDKTDTALSATLKCEVYDSPSRRAALVSCGWAHTGGLSDVLAECEQRGEIERAAALAVWHDDLQAAVLLLQRADSTNTAVQLAGMCIAGYNNNNNGTASTVWQQACSNLLSRPELEGNQAAYLRSLLRFLLNIGSSNGLGCVLDDADLGLCDRVAFACRFLGRSDLKRQLEKWIRNSQETGNLEGLIITGVVKSGLEIVQTYVDITADVQTAALVTCRVLLPETMKWERKVSSEWLDSYRNLLNSWQMWHARAMFDVERAELLRKIERAQENRVPRGRSQSQKGKGAKLADSVLSTSIPPQLDARCNYCSVSLSGARKQDGYSSRLSESKPVLSCCPRCWKPLPRCAICLLSLGVLNPYTELQRRPRAGNDDMSSVSSLPFSEWFTWCMSCKHGGHAHHLVGWFANHETCPVSGCDCNCQFDGIKKLAGNKTADAGINSIK